MKVNMRAGLFLAKSGTICRMLTRRSKPQFKYIRVVSKDTFERQQEGHSSSLRMPAKWRRRRRLAGRPKSFRDSQPAGSARSGPSAQNSLPCRPASLPLPSALIRKANSACSFTAPVLTSLAVHSVSLHTRVLYSLLYVLLSLNSLSEKKSSKQCLQHEVDHWRIFESGEFAQSQNESDIFFQ